MGGDYTTVGPTSRPCDTASGDAIQQTLASGDPSRSVQADSSTTPPPPTRPVPQGRMQQ